MFILIKMWPCVSLLSRRTQFTDESTNHVGLGLIAFTVNTGSLQMKLLTMWAWVSLFSRWTQTVYKWNYQPLCSELKKKRKKKTRRAASIARCSKQANAHLLYTAYNNHRLGITVKDSVYSLLQSKTLCIHDYNQGPCVFINLGCVSALVSDHCADER